MERGGATAGIRHGGRDIFNRQFAAAAIGRARRRSGDRSSGLLSAISCHVDELIQRSGGEAALAQRQDQWSYGRNRRRGISAQIRVYAVVQDENITGARSAGEAGDDFVG